MALQQAILGPTTQNPTHVTVNGSSSDIVLGNRVVFSIAVAGTSGQAYITFGNSTNIANGTTASWPVFVNQNPQFWDTGDQYDRIRIFTSASLDVYIYPLSRF